MRHNTETITGFSGGGYNSKFVLNMDTGPTYKEILLVTNLDNDQLPQISLTLNGDTIVDVTGEELRTLEAYKNRNVASDDGLFIIPLADLSAKSQEGQDLTELVTLADDNLVLEIRTGAQTAQQVTDSMVPTMEAVATMGAAKPVRVVLPRLYSELIPAGSSGLNKYRNFTRGPRIRRMHINGPVTELEIKRDRLTRFNLKKSHNDYLLGREKLVPQAGFYHFDPLVTRFAVSDMLQTAGESFEINPTVSSAGDLNVLFETVERVA